MATATEERYRSATLSIPYFNVRIRTLAVGRKTYFPAKAFCEALGLQWRAQQRRLDDLRIVPHLALLPMATTKGLRDTRCVAREGVAIWLTLIEPGKCKIAETQDKLAKFQEELFAAADRFLFGDTSDAVYDAATKQTEPIIGTLSVGHCPGCGMALRLEYTDGGAHLAPESDE